MSFSLYGNRIQEGSVPAMVLIILDCGCKELKSSVDLTTATTAVRYELFTEFQTHGGKDCILRTALFEISRHCWRIFIRCNILVSKSRD